jgi:hypothetical protein
MTKEKDINFIQICLDEISSYPHIRDDCLFFINMLKILFTSNMRLFFNFLYYVQASWFLSQGK